MFSTRKLFIPTALLLALGPASAGLQAQEVFVTASSNEVRRVDFAGIGGSTTLVIDAGGNLFQGLDVRGDGLFGVCDHNSGGRVFLFEANSTNPSAPDSAIITTAQDFPVAISFDPDGNGFIVDGATGVPDVWRVERDLDGCPPGADPFDGGACPNGGYLAAEKIDRVGGANTLADVKFVTSDTGSGELESGDIIVLVLYWSRIPRSFCAIRIL